MPIKHLGKKYQLGIARQAVWNTPVADNGAFRHVFADAGSVNDDPDVIVDEDNLTSGNGIHAEFERSNVDSTSGLPKISYTMPVDIYTLAPHMFGALQGGTEADVQDGYEKSVNCGGRSGVIDFNGNAGFLHTLALNPLTSNDAGLRLTNAIIDSYTLSVDFNARGKARKAQASVTWVGSQLLPERVLSGAWVKAEPNFLHTTDTLAMSSLQMNGINWASEVVRRFEINVQDNAARNAVAGQGIANQFDISPVITGSIILDLNAVTEKVLGDYMSQSRNVLSWAIGNGIDTRTLKGFSMSASKCRLIANPHIYNGDFLGVQLNFKCYSENGGNVVICNFSDGNDWGY